MAGTRSLNVGATIALGLFAAMCGERPGAKVRVQPLEKAAAGNTSGAAAAAGRGTMGSSGGTAGTANGRVGSGGESAGEGGNSAPQTPDDTGTMQRGGTSSRGGTAGRTSTGGSGAIDGSGDTGATDASGGTAGDDATSSDAGHDAGGTAGDTGGTGTGGRATGGSAGQALGGNGGNGASSGAGAGGSGGQTTSCELKTGCCAAGDPPCIDGCPLDADFCCDVSMGARIQCNAAIDYTAVVCLDCDGQSFGTQACSTSCVVGTDPPCSDDTWDDLCSTGGSAHCSDTTAGYRAGCYSADGGSLFHSYISCTCDPDS